MQGMRYKSNYRVFLNLNKKDYPIRFMDSISNLIGVS